MAFKEIDPAQVANRDAYHLMTSLVVPRPIAWVSTLSTSGVRNVAPHSYFNGMSSDPLIIHFTSTRTKDSFINARDTGEFVVNVVSRDLAEDMNLTAANFPPEEDEFSWARLEDAPSLRVRPSRVAAAKAAFECKVIHILELGNGNMVFGEVVMILIEDSVMREGRVDPNLLMPVGRLGGSTYTDAAQGLFDLKRPRYEDVRQDPPA